MRGHVLLLYSTTGNVIVLHTLRETKYMEVGRHWGMTANEHMTVGSNSYEKMKILDIFTLWLI
jgi:hypothetical protein